MWHSNNKGLRVNWSSVSLFSICCAQFTFLLLLTVRILLPSTKLRRLNTWAYFYHSPCIICERNLSCYEKLFRNLLTAVFYSLISEVKILSNHLSIFLRHSSVCRSRRMLFILHVNHFHFFFSRKTLFKKIYRPFMEMRWQINGEPLAKIKLFFYIDRHKLAGYFCHIDFTHHICAVVVHVHFRCLSFIRLSCIYNFSRQCHNRARTAKHNKKVWKRNIDEIYDFEPNPIMQRNAITICIAFTLHLLVSQWQCSLQIRPY